MRIQFEELAAVFEEILESRGVREENARICARNFAASSADGVYTHGANRFPKFVSYLEKGLVQGNAEPECIYAMGAMECWDGHLGIGSVNGTKAMDRACALAETHGLGMVALRNTSHWMRGGAYGWQAADRGFIGICWTNSMPNMPPWGGRTPKLGNNPLVFAVPVSDGDHVVVDMAMSQFSYGKIQQARLRGEELPVPGGWDTKGNPTTDPAEIEKSRRIQPAGYWKGSGLSILLDLTAALLSGGDAVMDIGAKYGEDAGVSQVFLAIRPPRIRTREEADRLVKRVLDDIKTSEPENGPIFYPGEIERNTRRDHLEHGIPVLDPVWKQIQALRKGGYHG